MAVYRSNGFGDLSHQSLTPHNFSGKIKNKWLRSFLYYVPYACLSAMTFPAIFFATQSVWSAVAGVAIALLLAFFNRSLITVAAGACLTVLVVEQLMPLF